MLPTTQYECHLPSFNETRLIVAKFPSNGMIDSIFTWGKGKRKI
jgi:hypothetical protein